MAHPETVVAPAKMEEWQTILALDDIFNNCEEEQSDLVPHPIEFSQTHLGSFPLRRRVIDDDRFVIEDNVS